MPTTEHVHAARVDVDARTLAFLADIDYGDAFGIAALPGPSAQQWARAGLEGGSEVLGRVFGLLAWQGLLGFRLAPCHAPETVAGWTIVESRPELVVLRAEGWLMESRMVFLVSGAQVTFTTLLRYRHPLARPVWALAGHLHRALAPGVLEQARRGLHRHP